MTESNSSEAADADRPEPPSNDRPIEPSSGSSPAVINAIARAERRRFDHRYTKTRRKKAVAYVLLALLLPLFGAMVWGAYRFGRTVESGEIAGLLSLFRWYLPAVIGLYVLVGANEAGKRLLDFDARELLLTTVRDRDLVLGLLVADLRESVWYLFGPAAALVLAFAVGVGSPTVAVVATTAAVLVTLAAMLGGYALGLAGRLALRRVPLSSTARSALGGLGSAGVFLLFVAGGAAAGQAGASLDLGDTSPAELTPDGSPPLAIGYYADFFFVGTPIADGVGTLAIGSGAIVVAAIPVSVWATVSVAPRLWRAESAAAPSAADAAASDETESTAAERRRTGPRTRTRPWLQFPSGYVADGLVRRSVRTPRRLLHLVYYAMAAGYVVVSLTVADPALLPTALGAALVLLGVWLAGGAVGLNPLGEEGSMVGELVLADYPPASFVRARVLVGTAVGLPFVLVGTALLTVRTLAPAEGLLIGGFAAALLPASAGFAVGIGTLLPNSEPGTVLEKFEARPPEKLAILAHGAVTTALAVAGGWLLYADLEPLATWGGLAVVGGCALLAADAGYRFAVSGLADYGRPRRSDPAYALELALGLSLVGLVLSLSLEGGAATQLPVSGRLEFAVAFVAGYVGWALAGAAYLLASGRGRAYLDVAVPSARDVRYVAVGLAASLVAFGALQATVTLFDLPAVEHAVADRAGGGPAFLALLAVLFVAVNAPVEEFLFRNVVQKRLAEAVSERTAIGAASIVFAAVHLPAYFATDPVAIAVSLAPLAVVAAVWGWIYARTDNLVVPALCHGLYNVAIAVVPLAFGTAA